MLETSWPSTEILPRVGLSRPAASFRVKVFPVPVSPRSTNVSRAGTEKETPRRMSPSPKPRETLSNTTAGPALVVAVAAAGVIEGAMDYRAIGQVRCGIEKEQSGCSD